MQVVHDRRLPFELDLGHVLREREHLAHAVAVVVVRDVLAPIHQRRPLLAGLLAVVIGVDLLLATVHFDDRRDEGDDVVANLLDERRLLHDEPIRQLLEHLRSAVLGRVHAARDVVDRLRRLQQLLRLRLGGLPRVGQLREHVLVFRQLLDRRLVGDREQDHVAALLGLAERPHQRAIGGLVDRLEIAMDVFRIRQLAGRPDDAAVELERSGHAVRRRQVIDQLGADPRVGHVFLDLRRVLGVDLLRRRRPRVLRVERDWRRQRGQGQAARDHAGPGDASGSAAHGNPPENKEENRPAARCG